MARYIPKHYGIRNSYGNKKIYIIGVVAVIILIIIASFILTSDKSEKEQKEVLSQADTNPLQEETTPIEPVVEEVEIAAEPKVEAEVEHEQVLPEIEESNSQIAMAIAEAIALINAQPSRIIKARETLNDVLHNPMTNQQREAIKKLLTELSERWLFSKTVYPEDSLCGLYKVQPGDSLSEMGSDHKVPWEILLQINNISRPEALQAGQNIKVINGPFHARVFRSSFTMDLYLNDTYVRSFAVGLGKPGRETPTGLWVAEPGGKLISPPWTDPDTGRMYHPEDPDYPLGSRWVGLEGLSGNATGREGFAFHGTNDANLIGTQGSRGCIRLHNGDVILVYNLMMPGYSKVEITD